MTQTFEDFALNHEQHHHCAACGGCLLRQDLAQLLPPFWCSGCAIRLCKATPVGAPLPFDGGVFFSQGVVDAYCERGAAAFRATQEQETQK